MKSAFERIYQKYFVDRIIVFHKKLSGGKLVLPDLKWQKAIIQEVVSRKNDCFRFIDDVSADCIRPLTDKDKDYPFADNISNKDFLKLIHPNFLIPYLVQASFSYEISVTSNFSWRDLIIAKHEILVPLKLPGSSEYVWYIQNGRILTMNENNQIISHINCYRLFGEFVDLVDSHEKMFVRATILKDQFIYGKLQELLKEEIKSYFKSEVFKIQHWTIILGHLNGNLTESGYEKETIKSYTRDILQLMQENTGYKFASIKDVLSYLKKIQVI